MIRIDVYPVMDGVELWVTGVCPSQEPMHSVHRGEKASTYLDRERIDKQGLEACLGWEIGVLLTEFSELAKYAFC